MSHNTLVVSLLLIALLVCSAMGTVPLTRYDPLRQAVRSLYGLEQQEEVAQTTCKKSDIDSVAKSVNDLLDALSVDVVAAVKKDDVQFQSMAALGALASNFDKTLKSCSTLLTSFVTGVRSVDVTIPNTKACVAKPDTTEFKNDPCCSQEAADNKCCMPRSVNINANAITSWANTTINNNCRHPEQVKSLISNYYRRYKDNMHQCAASVYKDQVTFAESAVKVSKCYAQVFQEADQRSCQSDDDCYTGATCDTSTNKCSGVNLADSTPLVDCLKQSLPAEGFYNLKYILGAEGKTDAQVAQVFTNFISSEMCVDGFLPFIPKTQFASESTCLADKKCSDNTDTCKSGSFCGALQAANGIFLADITAFQPSQAECTKHGYCVGAKSEDTYKLSKSECEAEYFCTDSSCGSDCTKEKCQALGNCVGHPVNRDFCLLPFSYNANGRFCATGLQVANGCVSTSITVESICKTFKGAWFKNPDTQAKCEAFQICAYSGAISFASKSDCEQCGGKSVTAFKWVPASYIKRRFLPVTKWSAREQKSINIWKRVIDIGKLVPAATKFILALQYPILRSYLSCVFNPAVTTLRALACDCDESVDANAKCFSDEMLSAPAASFRVLGSVDIDQEYTSPGVSIFISANSRKTTVNIRVNKTEVVVDVSITNARKLAADEGIPVKMGSTTVGQLVGSGYAAEADSGSLTAVLCIDRDTTMVVSNAMYTNPAFAVKDRNGNYIVTSVPIHTEKTGDGSSRICGRVSDSRYYYPAMVNDAAAPPTVSSAFSARPLLSFAYMLVACVLFFIMM